MNDQKDLEIWSHAQCFETLFGVVPVFDGEGVFILQRNHGIRKINTVFAEILGSLPWIPFNIHMISVCTFCVHVNVDQLSRKMGFEFRFPNA